MSSIVLRSGTVFVGDSKALMPNTDVVVDDGKVRELRPAAAPDRRGSHDYDAIDTVIDVAGKLVMPGVINNHSHGTVDGPLFPSGHVPLGIDEVLRNLDRALAEGVTTLLNVDGFGTAKGLERTRRLHPMNIFAATCNTPRCLEAAQVADGTGLTEEAEHYTADMAVSDGAVALGEIGAGHTLGGGGASYLAIPNAVESKSGVRITPAQANALKYAVLGRHISEKAFQAERVQELIEEFHLAKSFTVDSIRELIISLIIPAFNTALDGIGEAAKTGRQLGVPVLVHNAAASMDAVRAASEIGARLIAGHSNHDSFLTEESLEHAERIRKNGAIVDISTLDGFGARRLVTDPTTFYTLLEANVVDTISTDYAAGHYDSILKGIQAAITKGVVTMPEGLSMATSNVADAIPGLAPNRGRLTIGAVADIVVTDIENIADVDTVLVSGAPVLQGGEPQYDRGMNGA